MLHEIKKIFDALHKLNFILSREQKLYCAIMLVLAFISSLLEIMGVSIVVPLLTAILSVDELRTNPIAAPIFSFFHLTTNEQIILFICSAIALVYIAKNAFSIFYTWANAKFANKIKRELALEIFNTYIAQGYSYFANHNSAKILLGIDTDPYCVQGIITNLFLLIVRLITVIGIVIFIVIEAPYMAIVLLFLTVFSFGITELIFKKRMTQSGIKHRQYTALTRQTALEAIQGSKEIYALNRQKYFTDIFSRYMIKGNKANVKQVVGTAAPMNILEAICISGIVFAVALQVINASDVNELITKIATIAVAAFRILPYLGSILGYINSIIFNAPGLVAAYNTLYEVKELKKGAKAVLPESKDLNIRFQKEIRLSHITFSYSADAGNVLDDLNLTIKKGVSIGLIGTSGAGKTTLADIILALYRPQSGTIQMDGMDIDEIGSVWHHITGYIPQSVYLCDASVRTNVAFGIEEAKINDEKIWRALEMAQLKPFIESLTEGLDTQVGEWGVKFSGGQRQRIAIARALYNDPDVLIMDEATASLDNETEQAVMESIEALQGIKTLIIVAHRLTTIEKCDEIYEITDGKAVLRTHDEVFGS